VSPVRYELGSYIPEDGILHSHRRGNLKSYIIIAFLKTLTHIMRHCIVDVNISNILELGTFCGSVQKILRHQFYCMKFISSLSLSTSRDIVVTFKASLFRYRMDTGSDSPTNRHSIRIRKHLEEWRLLGCYAVWLL
jgi:hypothetical protein